ncbi:MAG: cation:proton antiporter, partial [Clostridia bacterium]|nr:cation:proton antiporter [Clostridia bacterium]
MEIYLISIAVAMLVGLMLTRPAKLLGLPAVTGYLVAGLLIGPYVLGAFGIEGLGFTSMEQVESMSILTQTALGFIAFTIGNEFRLSQLKSMGKKAITIGIAQAVGTTIAVDAILIAVHLMFPNVLSLPSAIVLGAIASATAPAATLMVVRQYKADGPLTRLLMLVVAIDDAVGLILFSVSFGVASAISHGSINV